MPVRVIGRSFEGEAGLLNRGRVRLLSLNEKAQRPPGSPLDQYLTLDIDPPADRLSEKFAQPLDSMAARLGSIDSFAGEAGCSCANERD